MVTPVFCCGFECGVTTAGAGHILPQGTSTPTISTTTVRTGLRAGRLNPTAALSYFNQDLTSTNAWVIRVYVRFATLPNATIQIAGEGTWKNGAWFNSSDNKIYAGDRGNGSTVVLGATGISITTGQWYRVDVKCNETSGAQVIDVQVDGAACGQHTNAFTGIGGGELVLGSDVINFSGDIFYDDLLVSQTLADYPIGAGFVKSYIPNADGTHNVAGANDFERSATGTDITNATTDAYTLIDDRPLKTTTITEYIKGIAPPNSTDYVEWQYEDSTEADPPRAVEAILALSDAATAGANDATITLREHAGATSANIHTGDIAATSAGTAVYKRAHFATVPGTSDAWTTTKFNALRSRFLVTDAAPDPWVASAMLEAEFPEVVAAEPTLDDDFAPLQILVVDDAA